MLNAMPLTPDQLKIREFERKIKLLEGNTGKGFGSIEAELNQRFSLIQEQQESRPSSRSFVPCAKS